VSETSSPNIYQRFAATLEGTQWLNRADLDAYREHLLRRLVLFASTHSPFYRERLKPLFRGSSEPQLNAWGEVPVLRRSDLECDIERINPVSVPDEIGTVSTMRTSGTTGGRATFRTCMLARIAAECMMHRHYCWHELDHTAPMASVRYYSSGRRICPEGVTEPNWSAVKPGAAHHTLDVREPVANIISWLVQRAPKYLLTFPSMMQDIGQHPDASEIADLNLGKIIGISEGLTPHMRNTVQERLGCEIAQIYACAEMGCIALQAPADDHYLACEETVFLEILDDNGNPVEPGETGRVVLTSFYNYATPFIRYEIGDYATLAAAPCPSERALMRLQRIDGRSRNALRSKSGQRVWPHEVPISQLAASLSSSRFQIRQPDRATIEIAFVAGNGREPINEKQVGVVLAHLLGGAVNVRVQPVDELARTVGGKRELVVSMAH